MKRTSNAKSRRAASNDMRSEYDFDYRKARRNRFATRMDKSRLVVVLDPDIAKVFTTPESVNSILRALIKAMSTKGKMKTTHKLVTGQ